MIAVPTQPLVSILSNVSLDPNVGYENKSLRRMQDGIHKCFCVINLTKKRIFICMSIKHLHPIATPPSAAHNQKFERDAAFPNGGRLGTWARRQGHGVAIQSPPVEPVQSRRGHSARLAAAARRSERRCRVYPIRFDTMWVEGIAGLNLGGRLSRKAQSADEGQPRSRRSFRVIQPLLAKTRTIFHSVGDEPFSADLHGAFSRARCHRSSTHSKSARAVYLRVAHAMTATVIILARSVSEATQPESSLTLQASMVDTTTSKRCCQRS